MPAEPASSKVLMVGPDEDLAEALRSRFQFEAEVDVVDIDRTEVGLSRLSENPVNVVVVDGRSKEIDPLDAAVPPFTGEAGEGEAGRHQRRSALLGPGAGVARHPLEAHLHPVRSWRGHHHLLDSLPIVGERVPDPDEHLGVEVACPQNARLLADGEQEAERVERTTLASQPQKGREDRSDTAPIVRPQSWTLAIIPARPTSTSSAFPLPPLCRWPAYVSGLAASIAPSDSPPAPG